MLIRKIAFDVGRWDVVVPRPIRAKRDRLLDAASDELRRTVTLAVSDDEVAAVLIVVDADDDCPAEEGANLLARAAPLAQGRAIAAVIAKKEYEAWFLTGGDPIAGHPSMREDAVFPDEPESVRGAKERLESLFKHGHYYSETVDQPAFSDRINLVLARTRSRSFDKFYRDAVRMLSLCPVPTPPP